MLTARADGTLAVFIVSIIFVIQAVEIPVKLPHFGKIRIPIDLRTAPIVAIAILWAAQCIGPAVIRNGIVGTEGVKPYNILILFFSLAYMAITLDVTGVLRAAAYWVSNKGGTNGWRLYFYFYVLLTLLSVLLGNDPVILSGTAFLVYYTDVVEELRSRGLPWLITEFAAANTASMVLFVGNPTNVVICEGFSVNNAAFTAYTIFPFIACSVACFIALALQYGPKNLPRHITATELDPLSQLRDPVSAWVGSIFLGTCLVIIIVVSFFGIDVWQISLPFAVAKFIFDFAWDYYKDQKKKTTNKCSQEPGSTDEKLARISSPTIKDNILKDNAIGDDTKKDNTVKDGTMTGLERTSETAVPDEEREKAPGSTVEKPTPENGLSPETENKLANGGPRIDPDSLKDPHRQGSLPSTNSTLVNSSPGTPRSRLLQMVFWKRTEYPPATDLPVVNEMATTHSKQSNIPPPADEKQSPAKSSDPPLEGWKSRFPTFFTALPRLPFALVPFAFSQFILIEALAHQGWIQVFAEWLVRASGRQMYPTIWIIGVMGVILCNISGTNIGATILLTKVVRAANMPNHTLRAAAIALAVASNIGAVSFTFSASLAGLLWRSILSQKGVTVTQFEFAKWNLLPLATMTSIGLAVVSIEMAVLYPGLR